MAETKITKAMIVEMIKEECADNELIVGYCDNELALLAGKAEKAKERAAAKKAAGDELRGVIQEILTDATEPMTSEMILESIDSVEDLTVAKIRARASQLCEVGLAHKVNVTVDGKKKVAYVIGAAEDAE